MLTTLLRAMVLVVIAGSAGGCCAALTTVCDCVSCLANGPRLPFVAAPPPASAPRSAPLAPARATVGARARMAY